MANPEPETIVKEAETVAVVGLSNDPEKYSHEVGSYLKEQGYRIIPVNPTEDEVIGERAYETVDQIPEQIDVVDVFLPPEKTSEIAEDAVRARAKALWLQEGIENEQTPDSRGRRACLRGRSLHEENPRGTITRGERRLGDSAGTGERRLSFGGRSNCRTT